MPTRARTQYEYGRIGVLEHCLSYPSYIPNGHIARISTCETMGEPRTGTFINWYARRRHEKACRLADAEGDKLLCLALAGDVHASLQLGMSNYSDPRRTRWQDWNPRTHWGNAIRAAFLFAWMALTIYGIAWQAYSIFKWGVAGPPEPPSAYPQALSRPR